MVLVMANSEKPRLTAPEPASPVPFDPGPPPFEHPLLKPMRPEDMLPEGESILTFVPKKR
jgi:hypothetical protein